MSRRVLDSSVSDEDIDRLMDSIVAQNPHLNERIETVHNENNVFVCKILRIYPYEDKALVKVLNNNKDIFCRLSHEVLGKGICVDYLPDGVEKIDRNYLVGKSYVSPIDELYGIVIKVRWLNLSDENVLLGYVNIHDSVNLKTSNDKGELSLKSGSSIISVNNERVNIMTPALFVNGLPHDEPELKNYYDKTEINSITESIEENSFKYDNLIEVIDKYNLTSDEKYTLFRGDCWTINNNFESSASITSETKNDFTVTGTFRTDSDLVGIYWNSKDLIEHPYISYGSKYDYTDVVLEFDYVLNGCREWTDDYNDTSNPCVITINKTDGSVSYALMYPHITNNHVRIDFNNLKAGDGTNIDVKNISSIMLMLKPSIDNGNYNIIENIDFDCEVTNITVTNGYICNEHLTLKPHQYRLCEGYDDFYNLNPYRICKEMRKLGYTEWCDLYIGASHFYEKSGTVGDRITTLEFNHTRTSKMVLDETIPLNRAFSTWLDCYSRELKKNDCPHLVISVSMENLQCPNSWKQRDSRGNLAMTGWIPSTFFYSPCHEDVLPYMQSVSEACLDIVVANDMQPILQLGEAWWWWNEYVDPVYRSPCFYDEKTKAKYKEEFGENIPLYKVPTGEYDEKTINWLNKQIVNYSWGLREVVKNPKYENGMYTALFFPPSVLDEDRVPPMMQKVNYLSGIYSPDQLDLLQLEDYDWVTGISEQTKMRDRSHHNEVYEIGQKLGFTVDKLHYFGGFVQYPEDSGEFWIEIKKAMDDAIAKGFSEVYVWAGSQVRRDGKMLGYDAYELVQKLSKLN